MRSSEYNSQAPTVTSLSQLIRINDGSNSLPFDHVAQIIRQWAKLRFESLPGDVLLDAIDADQLTRFLEEINPDRKMGAGLLAEKSYEYLLARVGERQDGDNDEA